MIKELLYCHLYEMRNEWLTQSANEENNFAKMAVSTVLLLLMEETGDINSLNYTHANQAVALTLVNALKIAVLLDQKNEGNFDSASSKLLIKLSSFFEKTDTALLEQLRGTESDLILNEYHEQAVNFLNRLILPINSDIIVEILNLAYSKQTRAEEKKSVVIEKPPLEKIIKSLKSYPAGIQLNAFETIANFIAPEIRAIANSYFISSLLKNHFSRLELIDNKILLRLITSQEGFATLAQFTRENSSYGNKITIETLCRTPTIGPYADTSALLYLTYHPKGFDLLDMILHPSSFNRSNIKTFFESLFNIPTQGPFRGYSAILEFAFAKNKKALSILESAAFRGIHSFSKYVPTVGINKYKSLFNDPNQKCFTPFLGLSYRPEGHYILEKLSILESSLFSEIKYEDLFKAISQEEGGGKCSDFSPFLGLTRTDHGQNILEKIFNIKPNLISMIKADDLFKGPDKGYYTDCIAFQGLAETRIGRVILEKIFTSLDGKSSSITPTQVQEKVIPTLFHLCRSKEGQDFISRYDAFCKILSSISDELLPNSVLNNPESKTFIAQIKHNKSLLIKESLTEEKRAETTSTNEIINIKQKELLYSHLYEMRNEWLTQSANEENNFAKMAVSTVLLLLMEETDDINSLNYAHANQAVALTLASALKIAVLLDQKNEGNLDSASSRLLRNLSSFFEKTDTALLKQLRGTESDLILDEYRAQAVNLLNRLILLPINSDIIVEIVNLAYSKKTVTKEKKPVVIEKPPLEKIIKSLKSYPAGIQLNAFETIANFIAPEIRASANSYFISSLLKNNFSNLEPIDNKILLRFITSQEGFATLDRFTKENNQPPYSYNQITIETLCRAPSIGPYAHISPLLYLTYHPKGFDLLDKILDSRSFGNWDTKIFFETLFNIPTQGPYTGCFVILEFVLAKNKKALSILNKAVFGGGRLLPYVPTAGINNCKSLFSDPNQKYVTPFLGLSYQREGHFIINVLSILEPSLYSEIRHEDVFKTMTLEGGGGKFSDFSPFLGFTRTSHGQNILKEIFNIKPNLISMIKADDLFKGPDKGDYANCIAFQGLATTSVGRDILEKIFTTHPTLLSNLDDKNSCITPTQVQEIVIPTLFHLCGSKEGQDFISRYDAFCKILSSISDELLPKSVLNDPKSKTFIAQMKHNKSLAIQTVEAIMAVPDKIHVNGDSITTSPRFFAPNKERLTEEKQAEITSANEIIHIKQEEANLSLDELIDQIRNAIKVKRNGHNNQVNCGHLTFYIITAIKNLFEGKALPQEMVPTTSSYNTTLTEIQYRSFTVKEEEEIEPLKKKIRKNDFPISAFALPTNAGLHANLPYPESPYLDLSHSSKTVEGTYINLESEKIPKVSCSFDKLSATLKMEALNSKSNLIGQIALANLDPRKQGHVFAFLATLTNCFFIDAHLYNGLTKTGDPIFDDLSQLKNDFHSNCFYLTHHHIPQEKLHSNNSHRRLI